MVTPTAFQALIVMIRARLVTTLAGPEGAQLVDLGIYVSW
jgi:hypothetical protein